MKKKLTLLIFFLPALLMAQTEFNNGTLTIDFGSKKKRQQQDSTEQKQDERIPDEEDEAQPKPKKEKRQSVNDESPDFRKDGIFKALFHAGINGSQVDGDGYAGYNYAGVDAGVGVMVRFHKFLSVSMEMNYSMEGAKQAFLFNPNPATLQKYRLQWDYIQVPISLNIHDKKLIMFSLGLQPGVMIRYKEQDEQGQDDTNNPPNGQPRRFDLAAFGMFNFLIKQHFGIGLKFSYSLLKIRGPQQPGISRINGEYNNVIGIRFMYILDTVKKKK